MFDLEKYAKICVGPGHPVNRMALFQYRLKKAITGIVDANRPNSGFFKKTVFPDENYLDCQ